MLVTVADIGDHNPTALLRQFQCDTLPQTFGATSASDNRNLALQIAHNKTLNGLWVPLKIVIFLW